MADAREQRFLDWLAANGAVFPKLQWPASSAGGRGRGVVARADITALEPMLQIPAALVISEQRCWQDPQLRVALEANRDVFARDDPVLALFLVREQLKGDASFFAPYLAILPFPESVQDWSDDELAALHDRRLVAAARRRQSEIDAAYDSVFAALDASHPGEFPRAQYTREKFVFAWKTIQARTFGRRLPWTALVPFADCLNHANVATKYDFDVARNGMFRLFPSAATAYAAGAEVFNSYGRRSNFHLLLDYGFALRDNEWDYVDIELPKHDAMANKFPFLRRLQLDRRSSLEDLFPVAVLGAFAAPPASGAPDSPSDTSAESSSASEAERAAVRAGYKWLRRVLGDALGGFGVSIQDAEQELKRDTTPERRRDALVYCLSRMNIVEHVICQIDAALERLASSTPAVVVCGSDASVAGVAATLSGVNLSQAE
ncbi:hypothetical protein PybrP1_008546 [[Pythium] brassicae (nom. inval.)]|nr:hypothetical protein PybrP1_008546 [[Pythium] brassicae (nom. inval.)]